MNEGVEPIIMNTATATTLVDVCVFMDGGVAATYAFLRMAAWRLGGSVAFFAAKRTCTGNMAKAALQISTCPFGAR
jgi:hypothetical protein